MSSQLSHSLFPGLGLRFRLWLLVVTVCLLAAAAAPASVTIHVIDVDQGDCTLVVSSSGQTLLFDGGKNGRGNSVVVPYLTSLGITELDYMVASHYHEDHVGGLDEVYDAIGVGTACYDRGWTYTSITYGDYADAVASKRTTINDDQVIDLGDGVTATCIAVNGNGTESSPYSNSSHENEYCVALLVECGDFDYFQAGDLPGGGGSYDDVETSVGPEAGDLEIYKVNHHGSYSSSNASFLAATTPEVSIISMSDGNSYGHPHQEVLNRLQGIGSFVYQTTAGNGGTLPSADLEVVGGHIVITTSGILNYTVDGDLWQMDEQDTSAVMVDAHFVLHGASPNPFNPATEIAFTATTAGTGRFEVYDAAGRLLEARAIGVTTGRQSVTWKGCGTDGTRLASGTYFYRLTAPDRVACGRMTMIK